MLSKSNLNLLGGIPDILFTNAGKFLIKKSNTSEEVYLKSLEFYLKFNTTNNLLFNIPESSPLFEVEPQDENIKLGTNYLFKSRYVPQSPMIASDFNIHKLNNSTSVRIWEHDKKSKPPIILCLHGFMLGNPDVAKKMFKIDKLFELGVDVGLYTLPHHGNRTNKFHNQHLINQHNIPLTLEGMAQAIHDLHSTVLILKELGYTKIGLIGASLGGLTSILYAAISDAIDFVFPVVPAVDLRDHLAPTNRSFKYKISDQHINVTSNILELITPICYRPKLPVNNIGGVFHAGDKLNNATLTRDWANNWNVTNLLEIPGGHWVYGNKKDKGRAWYSWLKKQDFIS